MSGFSSFLARQRSVGYLGLPVTCMCHIPLGKTSWNWVASVTILSHICARSSIGMEFRAGQSHLISDAKIADEGRPQGAPLLVAFSPEKGTHKGSPYRLRLALRRAPTRGAPTSRVLPWRGRPQGAPLPIAFGPEKGTHKGSPYRLRLALRRAPTRGAPTDSFGPGEGTHKGRPY